MAKAMNPRALTDFRPNGRGCLPADRREIAS